jgi:hypothetical protein
MACSKKKKKKKKKGGEKGLQGKNRRIKELMLMNDGIQWMSQKIDVDEAGTRTSRRDRSGPWLLALLLLSMVQLAATVCPH